METRQYHENKEIGQEQFYDMLISREIGWQTIIYDLIRTGQLDPWNIDLVLLAQKYLERLHELEQEHIFFISSKVLIAAAILLRIKSEILHENILSLDELLFEKKKKESSERLVTDYNVIDLIREENYIIFPRTPLPRARKITLQELMIALEKAINTEQRRIRKELLFKRPNYDLGVVVRKSIDIRKKIKELYEKIKEFFIKKKYEPVTFTELAGTSRDEKIACFLPLLHLDTDGKICLQQEKPFEEIYILPKEIKIPTHKELKHD